MRLLIVEDDVKLASLLKRCLGLDGYAVEVAHAGDEGLKMATATAYSAIVLDVTLPGMDGITLCQTLRSHDIRTPVLMLTARATVADRIRGLDSGADDYVVNPFHVDELRARLRVLVRRGPATLTGGLQVGSLQLDATTRVATRRGRQVELTARECDVLQVLARTPGRPVPRATLLKEVWPDAADVSPNVIDVYIGYLRKKLERPKGPRLIRTVRGKGFLLEQS